MKYTLVRVAPDEPRRIVEKFHTDLLSATIFARRGITSGHEIRYYLESGLGYLHSPFCFADMETAVQRINAAVTDGEKVCVFGDRDADGITSTALLVSELRSLGLEVSFRLPEGDSPYGLTMEAVEAIAADGVTLVITVDCGTSSNEEITALSELGIDTIVTDHHLPGSELPPALAIINPKVPECGYPFDSLAGCGVVSKLIWAIRFSNTDLYEERLILLHAEPGPGENTTTIVQAVQLENLVETERIVEELPNGAVDLEHSKLVLFLSRNIPIVVLDKETELLALRRAFGRSVDIALEDFRPLLESVIPRSRGKSLFTLSRESRAVLYEDGHEELETLISLFRSCCIYKYPSLSRDYERLMDYVAIGTIADLMPLRDENRILVRTGLKQMSEHPRQSLAMLLSEQNLSGRPLSGQDVGWYISPVINAAGRLGRPSVAVNLLLSDDIKETSQLTRQLLDMNKERQRIGEEAWQKVSPKAKESLESFGSKFLLVEDGEVPRGLTGALASRLIKEFPQVPAVMVMAVTDDERISASIRSKHNFPSRQFLSQFAEYFTDYGGHVCAGGFSMTKDQLAPFRRKLEEVVLEMDYKDEEEVVTVDALIPANVMSAGLIKTVELFEPYGEANPPLTFLMDGAEIMDVIYLGSDKAKGNLRLSVRYGKSLWPCVFWGSGDRFGRDFTIGDKVKLIFRMGRNYWKGSSFLQLTVLDLERV